MFGSRKSSTGCGVVWRYLLGATWRNARAAEDGFECISCEQLLLKRRVAICPCDRAEALSRRATILRDVRLWRWNQHVLIGGAPTATKTTPSTTWKSLELSDNIIKLRPIDVSCSALSRLKGASSPWNLFAVYFKAQNSLAHPLRSRASRRPSLSSQLQAGIRGIENHPKHPHIANTRPLGRLLGIYKVGLISR